MALAVMVAGAGTFSVDGYLSNSVARGSGSRKRVAEGKPEACPT
jgi:hypothetical protein